MFSKEILVELRTSVLYNREKGGTNVREQILKAWKHAQIAEMIYMKDNGEISKRTVEILHVSPTTFLAYCFLRKSKRTFAITNVLALSPQKNPSKSSHYLYGKVC